MTVDVLPPGPRLPAAVQSAAWIARPWKFMDRCAARYGDTFTLRPVGERPWVMVSHPDAVKEVFNGPPELLHAGEGNRILLPVVGANSVLLLDDDAHREQRRLLMPPFRGNQLAAYADTMTAVAKAEIARWPRGKPVRLHPLIQALTLEVILRAVFGLSEGKRRDQLRAELVRMLTTATSFPVQVSFLLGLGPLRTRVALTRRLLRGVDRLLYAEIAERHRADDLDKRGDVLSTLLRARHQDGQPMSDVEIRDELMTLLLAGHDRDGARVGRGAARPSSRCADAAHQGNSRGRTPIPRRRGQGNPAAAASDPSGRAKAHGADEDRRRSVAGRGNRGALDLPHAPAAGHLPRPAAISAAAFP